MIRVEEIAGVVLAGGNSTRMGQDKALLMMNGSPFIQRITQTLLALFDEVIISANTADYSFLGLPVVRDIYENCGPLGGVHAALGSVKTPYCFTTPCDTPRLNPGLVKTLLAEAQSGVITLASTVDRLQPLVGLYPVTCRQELEEFLDSGRKTVRDFIVSMPHHYVQLDYWAEDLENINDLSQLQRLIS